MPTLTLGLPPAVTAMTGVDAMVHAIEAYTSRHKKNPLSDNLALQALHLLSRNIRTAVREGGNPQARENMLLGACLAGQAFANAPVAAVHALAYPLGGHYHIPHGLSNSLVLPTVLEFNAPQCQCAVRGTGRNRGGRTDRRQRRGENLGPDRGPAAVDRRCGTAGNPGGRRGR